MKSSFNYQFGAESRKLFSSTIVTENGRHQPPKRLSFGAEGGHRYAACAGEWAVSAAEAVPAQTVTRVCYYHRKQCQCQSQPALLLAYPLNTRASSEHPDSKDTTAVCICLPLTLSSAPENILRSCQHDPDISVPG